MVTQQQLRAQTISSRAGAQQALRSRTLQQKVQQKQQQKILVEIQRKKEVEIKQAQEIMSKAGYDNYEALYNSLNQNQRAMFQAPSEIKQTPEFKQYQSYLHSDAGKMAYVKKHNIGYVKKIYGKLGKGYARQVMAYIYATPYGELVDRSPEFKQRQTQGKLEAYEHGFKNVQEYQDISGAMQAGFGKDWAKEQIQKKQIQQEILRGSKSLKEEQKGVVGESTLRMLESTYQDPTKSLSDRKTAAYRLGQLGGYIPQLDINLQIAKYTGKDVKGGISESIYRDLQVAAAKGDITAQKALAKVKGVIPQEQIEKMTALEAADITKYKLGMFSPSYAKQAFFSEDIGERLRTQIGKRGEEVGEFVTEGIKRISPEESEITIPQLAGTRMDLDPSLEKISFLGGRVSGEEVSKVPGLIDISRSPFESKIIKIKTTGEGLGKAVAMGTELGLGFGTPFRYTLGTTAVGTGVGAFKEGEPLKGVLKTGEAALYFAPEILKFGKWAIPKGAAFERKIGMELYGREGGILTRLEQLGSKKALKLTGLTKREFKELMTLEKSTGGGKVLSSKQFSRFGELRLKAIRALEKKGDVIGMKALAELTPSKFTTIEQKAFENTLAKLWAKREAATKGEVLSAEAAKLFGIKGAPKGIYTSVTTSETIGIGEKLMSKTEANALADTLVNMKIYKTKVQAIKEIREMTLTQATKKFTQLQGIPVPRIGAAGEVLGWNIKRLPKIKYTPEKYLVPKPQQFVGAGEGWKTKAFDLQLYGGAPIGVKGKILKPEWSLIKMPKLSSKELAKLAKTGKPGVSSYAEIFTFKPGKTSTSYLKGKGVTLKKDVFQAFRVKKTFAKVKDFKTISIKTPKGIKKIRSYIPEFRQLKGTKFKRATPLDVAKEIISPVDQKKLARLYKKSLPIEEQKIVEIIIPRGKEVRLGRVKLVKDGTTFYDAKGVEVANKFLRISKGKGVGRVSSRLTMPLESPVTLPGATKLPRLTKVSPVSLSKVPSIKPFTTTIKKKAVQESIQKIALKKVVTPSYVGGSGGEASASLYDMEGVITQKMAQEELLSLGSSRFQFPRISGLKYAPIDISVKDIGLGMRFAPGAVILLPQEKIQTKELSQIMIKQPMMKEALIQKPILESGLIQQPMMKEALIQQPVIQQRIQQQLIQQQMLQPQMKQIQVIKPQVTTITQPRITSTIKLPVIEIPIVPPVIIIPPTGDKFRPRRPLLPRRPAPQAFALEIKRRGKFVRVAKGLGRESALALGKRKTSREAAATFRLTKVGGPARRTRIRSTAIEKVLFRLGKKPGEYVQKKRLRIVTPGEVKQISYVGAAATKKSPGPIQMRKPISLAPKKKKKKLAPKKKRSTTKKRKKKK